MTKGFASAGVFSSHAAFTAASFQLSTWNQYGLPVIQFRPERHKDVPSVITIPSTPGCVKQAEDDDEVKTTLLTNALSAAFKIASVYATTLVMTTLGSVLNETSLA